MSSSLRHMSLILVLCAVVVGGCSTAENTSDSVDDTEQETTVEEAPAVDIVIERDFEGIDEVVSSFVTENNLNGAALLVVERDEGLVYENYWGEFGPDRVSLIASTSKILSAGVLFNLADQGLLDLDAPISDQTGWLPDNNQITVAQLLSNSSGLVGLGPNPAFGAYICQFLPFGTTEDCGKGIYLTAADDAEVVDPDTEFRYGGGQWQVAGGVAEAVSGKSWPELIDEIYVQPCGVETLGYSNHFALYGSGFDYPEEFDGDASELPLENPNIEGGAYIAPRDYADLLLMHLRDGRCGDTQVLSPASVERMQTRRVDAERDGNPDLGYGYGWWVEPGERVYDSGAYGAVSWLDNDERHGAYLVVESSGLIARPLQQELYDVVDGIMTQ